MDAPPVDTVAIGQRGELIALRLAEQAGWGQGRTNVRIGKGVADVVCFRVRDGQKEGLVLEVKSSIRRMPDPEHVQKRQLTGLLRMAARLASRKKLARVEVAVVLVFLTPGGHETQWLDVDGF